MARIMFRHTGKREMMMNSRRLYVILSISPEPVSRSFVCSSGEQNIRSGDVFQYWKINFVQKNGPHGFFAACLFVCLFVQTILNKSMLILSFLSAGFFLSSVCVSLFCRNTFIGIVIYRINIEENNNDG